MAQPYEDVTFSLTLTMPKAYAQCFVAMLNKMVEFGKNGHSEWLGFYADGDGCFRPSYQITAMSDDITKMTDRHAVIKNAKCEIGWDAG